MTITDPVDGQNYESGTSIALLANTSDPDGDAVTVAYTVNGSSITSPWSPADGSYTVTATATDGQGGSATDSVSITVGTITTPELVASSVDNGSTWTAIVTSTNDVSGTWTVIAGTTAVSSCTVGSSGSCQVSLSGIRKRVGSVTFTTSAGVQVVVSKP